jgi:hypothetical protein
VLTGDLGFRRGRGSGVDVPGIAVSLGEEEDADGERGIEASMVARSSGSRWPAEELRCG